MELLFTSSCRVAAPGMFKLFLPGYIVLVNHADDIGFCLNDFVIGSRIIAPADVTIAIRHPAEHVDLTLMGTMTLATARAFQDLRPFILGDHALELHQQLVFRGWRLRRLEEDRLDTMTGKFLDQQNLIRIRPAQAVGGMDQHGLDLPFGRQVAYAFQARTYQRCPAIAVVFEDPCVRYVMTAAACEVDQRGGLAANRVLLALLVGRYPGVDRCHRHGFSLSLRNARR